MAKDDKATAEKPEVKKDGSEEKTVEKEEETKEDKKEKAEEKESAKVDEEKEKKTDKKEKKKTDKKEEEPKDDAKDEGDDSMEVDGDDKKEGGDTKKKRKGEDDKVTPTNPNKRLRRSSQTATYQPEDFKRAQLNVQIFRGRGTKLKDIESVKASIDRYTQTSEEMNAAHKFLFTMRGKVARHLIKGNILEFSGFLKYYEEGKDKELMDQEDEDAESKYSTKAYKLTVAQIKQLCDFFNIDRSVGEDGKPLDKEALIDRLLDFLGSPNEKYTAGLSAVTKQGSAKKKTPAKKKSPNKTSKATGSPKKKKMGRPKKAAKEDDDDSTDEENAESEGGSAASGGAFAALKKHKKGEQPSDEVLREWVRAYIACFNMETSTAKHAIKTASEKFGLDLSKQKEKIKEILTEEM